MKNESRFFIVSAANNQEFNSQYREKIRMRTSRRVEAEQRRPDATARKDHPIFPWHESRQGKNRPVSKGPLKEFAYLFPSCFCRLKNGQLDTLDLFS